MKYKVVHHWIRFPNLFELINSDFGVISYNKNTEVTWSHQIWWEKKCKSHVWDSILRPIFDNENVGIRFNSWNTKLFIIELASQIFLNHSISIPYSEVMIKTLKPHDHTKSDERKKCRFHVWDSILRPIFDNENVRIRFNSWNTKLFIIELVFQIFLNQSIPISKS